MQKIVVIEDDKPIRDMYMMKLRTVGFEVEGAADGEEGLATTERIKPDIILLDLKMPVMNGDDMLEKLRQTDWGSNIRVVILTNLSKDEAPQKLRLLSVDRYIVKAHYTPAQVVEIVREVLDPSQ